ncbi:uncharacterized protein LOC131939350 [Physella acuta]|uniref:uncharacterized protein LOC131939350 n=1 Tax=Physella acuta TaxID=109671 RepID=UPI0027DC24EE|nr:uncharacterized protein LOC131939350 [Physella acuta]
MAFIKLFIVCLSVAYIHSQAINQNNYDAFYDLQTGTNKVNESVSIYVPFTGSGCSSVGVLKIALSKDDLRKKRVLVDLFMTNPTGWVFDLGDSDTNNGYAGDAMTQSSDAEVQGLNGILSAYNSDNGGSGLAFSLTYNYVNRLTLVAGDSQIVFTKDGDPTTTNYFNSPGLYGLNGQWQCEGTVNYDLYLGVNGVVYGAQYNGRTGSGVCKVGIKILPQI